MDIIKNRIINPRRYLYVLSPDESFYVAASLTEEDMVKLAAYGIEPDAPARVPIPHRGASYRNANGHWLLDKTKLKEERWFAHPYHVIDWHGGHHYGICYQCRMCYQRYLVPPTELAFVIEDGVLFSPLMKNAEEDMVEVKAAMNILLEMLGRCEIWTEEKAPALPPVNQKEVPWEILRAGTRDKDAWEDYVQKTIQRRPKGHQQEIKGRHEFLWDRAPEFCVLGTQNFWGYVVYGFPALNLFVFESNEINNATYVFRGDWEEASKLTKTEILSGHRQDARLYHTESWKANLGQLIARNSKTAA